MHVVAGGDRVGAFAIIIPSARILFPRSLGAANRVSRAASAGTTPGPLNPQDVEVGEALVISEQEVSPLANSDSDCAVVLDDVRVQVVRKR